MSESSLREQQSELTRELILEALSRLVSEEGMDDFSVQRVADLAGVSHRTVYRHFPSREALLEGLVAWLDERTAMSLEDYLPDRLEEAFRRAYAAFENDAEKVTAFVVLATGARVKVPRRSWRTGEFARLLAPLSRHLAPEDARAVAVLLRALGGSSMWFQLREEHELDAEPAARVTAWAARTLCHALESGEGPGVDATEEES